MSGTACERAHADAFRHAALGYAAQHAAAFDIDLAREADVDAQDLSAHARIMPDERRRQDFRVGECAQVNAAAIA